MNIAIDIGNTRAKVGRFVERSLVEAAVLEGDLQEGIQTWISQFQVEHAIVSSVRSDSEIPDIRTSGELITLNHNTTLPFEVAYKTPETLGRDRLAGVAAAHREFESLNVFIIDAGTCITYDFLTAEGTFLGGNIAPGLRMRLQSMSDYTARLPFVEQHHVENLIGATTEEALQNGAEKGVLLEIEGYKSRLEEEYGEVVTVITGGDAKYLAVKLKTKIFVRPDLVLMGLNEILRYNVV